MKIGFHDNSLNLRGTSVALFDYAYYNQKILGNESVIFYNINDINTNVEVLEKFMFDSYQFLHTIQESLIS